MRKNCRKTERDTRARMLLLKINANTATEHEGGHTCQDAPGEKSMRKLSQNRKRHTCQDPPGEDQCEHCSRTERDSRARKLPVNKTKPGRTALGEGTRRELHKNMVKHGASTEGSLEGVQNERFGVGSCWNRNRTWVLLGTSWGPVCMEALGGLMRAAGRGGGQPMDIRQLLMNPTAAF